MVNDGSFIWRMCWWRDNEGGREGWVVVDSLCYCLMTLFLIPLILRMWPEDSLYEIFRPEHWSRDINTLLTMPWIPYSRHWTSSSQQEDFLICGPLIPKLDLKGTLLLVWKYSVKSFLILPKIQAMKRPTLILRNHCCLIIFYSY